MPEANVSLAPPLANHRLDIDGMRAVAVLTVLAYHVGIHVVPGGFVGVDVFFVISGFVITQVLLRDIRDNKLSISQFYERRIRRIVPALLVVTVATFIVCAMYSLPGELVDLSKSMVTSALSASNIYFLMTGGYFSAPALTRPLLHTWSLAVEEQFYIIWPLYLWFGIRYFRSNLLSVTFAIIGVSLAVSAIGAFTNPSATFYLVHTRAWELLLGSVIPLGAFRTPLGPVLRNLLGTIGLALVVASSLLIQPAMPFPGLLALPPCLGAFLILLAGRDGASVPGRLLAWRPVAFIGLISYSVYLWHWPLTVFQRNYAALVTGGSDRYQKLVIIAYALVLGVLSWKFVEQPFRVGKWRPTRRSLFVMAGSGTLSVILIGLAGWTAHGFPERYSAHELQIASVMDFDSYNMFRAGKCFLLSQQSQAFADECLQEDPSKPNYLLLGDSHAAELWFGLHNVFTESHFLQATAADCFPVVSHGIGESSNCIHEIDNVLYTFLPKHKVAFVVLAARWKMEYLSRIERTLDWLQANGTPVILVGPMPVYDSPLPRLMITAQRTNSPGLFSRSWDHSLIKLDDELAALALRRRVTYISAIKELCSGYACETYDSQGLPLLSDEEHFTAEGSIEFAKRLRVQYKRVLESQLPRTVPAQLGN
jgi:peptidoglycan/LPS O-acetylase OafA/YrhL